MPDKRTTGKHLEPIAGDVLAGASGMTPEHAEEFTQALGQVVAGGWRVAALGERLGVPEALGMTTREWVRDRLGGYLKMTITERRAAVAELAEDGMTQRQTADVLGVAQATVHADQNRSRTRQKGAQSAGDAAARDQKRSRRSKPIVDVADFGPGTETVCPTCHGTGRVLLIERE